MKVTIFYGADSRTMQKEDLKDMLLEFYDIHTDGKKRKEVGNSGSDYLDIIEWIDINLHRISGIQLYTDGAIRLNIDIEYIEDGKKCIMLDDAIFVDESMTMPVYEFLKLLAQTEEGK